VRTLFNKRRGYRGSDRERSQFAFFVVGTVVLLAVSFVLGVQVGRIIEKNAEKRKREANRVAGPIEIRKQTESEIRKDLGVFSEEAGKVPSVALPSADARLNETEKNLTFRETLAKKEPEPVLLVKPSPGKTAGKRTSSAKTTSEGKLMVQAAAFRVRKMAESFRQRLEKGGFKATVVRGKSGKSAGYYKVFVGPYPNKDAANRAIRKLKSKWKVEAFLVRG
jgi:cell division protein FtsN